METALSSLLAQYACFVAIPSEFNLGVNMSASQHAEISVLLNSHAH